MPTVPVSLLRLRAPAALVLCLVLALAGALWSAPPARAADQGSGFGTWAPVSAYGWHGSMLVGVVHRKTRSSEKFVMTGAPSRDARFPRLR